LWKEFRLNFNCPALLRRYIALLFVLEYGVIICDPCTFDDSSQLERVQRTFLKFATFALRIECAPHEYQPVLECLHLSTLCDRRKQANLTFLSKLINGEVDSLALLCKLNFRVPSFYSRYSYPFQIPFSHCNYLTNRPIFVWWNWPIRAHYSLVLSIKLLTSLYLNICNFRYLFNFLLVIMFTIQCNWARHVFNNK